MERFRIEGGRRLSGSVPISGAKNAALPAMAAALLAEGQVQLEGLPSLRDVGVMATILQKVGMELTTESTPQGTTLSIQAGAEIQPEVSEELVRRMRSSILLLGPFLAKYGRAKLSYPGGCEIGSRPINLHLKAMRQLGATIHESHGLIYAEAEHGLIGTAIDLDLPSVGATENIMMAASLARGETRISNAACEPEIVDLANFLNKLGAKIEGAGKGVIHIQGVPSLGSAHHRILPDRIEAGTYLMAGLITGGRVRAENVVPEHLDAVLARMCESGAEVVQGDDWIEVQAPERVEALDFHTLPYPGFPTDLQSQMMAVLCLAKGTSIIRETIFENRFKVASELRRMGARIHLDGRIAVVHGVERLGGAPVEALSDLRGGAALVLAALAAEGESVVQGVQHIERGYEHMPEKLAALGAHIKFERMQKTTPVVIG